MLRKDGGTRRGGKEAAARGESELMAKSIGNLLCKFMGLLVPHAAWAAAVLI